MRAKIKNEFISGLIVLSLHSYDPVAGVAYKAVPARSSSLSNSPNTILDSSGDSEHPCHSLRVLAFLARPGFAPISDTHARHTKRRTHLTWVLKNTLKQTE